MITYGSQIGDRLLDITQIAQAIVFDLLADLLHYRAIWVERMLFEKRYKDPLLHLNAGALAEPADRILDGSPINEIHWRGVSIR